MKFSFKKKIGDTEFVFEETAEDMIEFFKKASVISGLPSKGPNGETDLVVTHRTTKEGHVYLSIVSKQASKEFQVGQSLKKKGEIFPKEWEPLFEGRTESSVTSQVTPAHSFKTEHSPQTSLSSDPKLSESSTEDATQKILKDYGF